MNPLIIVSIKKSTSRRLFAWRYELTLKNFPTYHFALDDDGFMTKLGAQRAARRKADSIFASLHHEETIEYERYSVTRDDRKRP